MKKDPVNYENYYAFVLGADLLSNWFNHSDLATDEWFEFCVELDAKILDWELENDFNQSYYETIRDYLNMNAEKILAELKWRFPYVTFRVGEDLMTF